MFELNDSHRMIQDMFRQYMTNEIEPIIDDIEDGKIPLFDPLRKMADTLGLRSQVDAMDLSRPVTDRSRERRQPDPGDPMEGLEVIAGNLLVKEMSRVSPGAAMSFGVSTGLAGGTILAKGTVEQKETFGRPLFKLDKIGAWCLTEPGAGSDALGSMRTTAVEEGDHYVLNGSKTFITNGPVADVFVVYAKLDRGKGEREIQNFIVLREDKGLSTGKPFQKMGMKASPTSEVFFDDCHLPEDRLIGGEEMTKTRDHVKEGLSNERSGMPAMALGIIERCFEISVQYAKQRVQFGRPLIDFQLIQNRLARMYVAMENVRNLFLRTIEQTIYGGQTRLDVCMGKLYCAEMATWVANEAIAILGGYGYMREYVVERLARDAKLLEIGAGTAEMQIITMGQELATRWSP
jgi:alkylation response protein AidB-like acyl-CoA dehydrogenase